jgi:hypothetical protein
MDEMVGFMDNRYHTMLAKKLSIADGWGLTKMHKEG